MSLTLLPSELYEIIVCSVKNTQELDVILFGLYQTNKTFRKICQKIINEQKIPKDDILESVLIYAANNNCWRLVVLIWTNNYNKEPAVEILIKAIQNKKDHIFYLPMVHSTFNNNNFGRSTNYRYEQLSLSDVAKSPKYNINKCNAMINILIAIIQHNNLGLLKYMHNEKLLNISLLMTKYHDDIYQAVSQTNDLSMLKWVINEDEYLQRNCHLACRNSSHVLNGIVSGGSISLYKHIVSQFQFDLTDMTENVCRIRLAALNGHLPMLKLIMGTSAKNSLSNNIIEIICQAAIINDYFHIIEWCHKGYPHKIKPELYHDAYKYASVNSFKLLIELGYGIPGNILHMEADTVTIGLYEIVKILYDKGFLIPIQIYKEIIDDGDKALGWLQKFQSDCLSPNKYADLLEYTFDCIIYFVNEELKDYIEIFKWIITNAEIGTEQVLQRYGRKLMVEGNLVMVRWLVEKVKYEFDPNIFLSVTTDDEIDYDCLRYLHNQNLITEEIVKYVEEHADMYDPNFICE